MCTIGSSVVSELIALGSVEDKAALRSVDRPDSQSQRDAVTNPLGRAGVLLDGIVDLEGLGPEQGRPRHDPSHDRLEGRSDATGKIFLHGA